MFMSKHVLHLNRLYSDNFFSLIGLFAALPAIYFVTGSILKYESGLLQGVQIHTFPPVVLLGGGLLAIALNIYPIFHLKVLRSYNAFTLSFTVNLKPFNLLVFTAGVLVILLLVGYVIVENLSPH
jgi:hypothetical protein